MPRTLTSKIISRLFLYSTVAEIALQAPTALAQISGVDSPTNKKLSQQVKAGAEQNQTIDQPADTILCPSFIKLDKITAQFNDLLKLKPTKSLIALRNIRPAARNVQHPSKAAQQKARTLNGEGLAMLRHSQPVAATQAFRAAVQSDPTEAQYFNNLSYVETHDGNLSNAEKHAYITLALDPMRTVTWGDLGVILAMKGDEKTAANSFTLRVLVAQDKAAAIKYLKYLSKNSKEKTVRNSTQQALNQLDSQTY
jgi:Flp pilus assembly protein TadD